MKTRVGLWIDHRMANTVAITDKGEVAGQITSKVETQFRRLGDLTMRGPYEPQEHRPPDDTRQRTFTGHLNTFYDAVITFIRDAESILIFGPGEAKSELKKRLERINLGGRVVGIETTARMTIRQIAAKVRRHFSKIVRQ